MTGPGSNAGSEVPPISESEVLARVVTDGAEARFAARNRAVHPGSFTRLARRDISVDRFSRMTLAEAVKNGHAIAAERGANRRFHGWALIAKMAVDDLEYTVEKSPREGHRWHADIWLPEPAATDPVAHQHHAARLARRADWQEKPPEGS